MCVPTLFVTGAGFFAVATATRSMMWTYVGVIVFLVLYLVATSFLARPEFINTVALVDPFGLGAYDQATRYWTATERNTQIPDFAGYILWNRALWIGVAFALLGLAWAIYSRAARGSRMAVAKAPDKTDDPLAETAARPVATPAVQAKPSTDAGWSPLWALARFDIAAAIRSPAFIVLLGIGFVNSLASLWYADEFYGNTIHPVTRVMIEALQGAFTIIPLIIAIYYAGELVWRDRERRMHEIIDSTPAPDWAFVVPKILAISIVLFSTLAASVLAAVVVQALKGYFDFEIGKYLLWYVVPTTVNVVLFAVLAIFMQTLVSHKTFGWMLMLLFVVAQVTLDRLGFEHNLYQYSGSPGTPLSDMNGQGDFARVAWWFRAYWSAAAVAIAVLAYALWRRGIGAPLKTRLAQVPRKLRGTPGWVAAASLVADAGSRRLDLLQHQRPESVHDDAEPRARPGRLREDADRLRERAATAHHRRQARRGPVSRRTARGDPRQLRHPEPHRPAARSRARALDEAAADDQARRGGRDAGDRACRPGLPDLPLRRSRWRRWKPARSRSRRCANSRAFAIPTTSAASSTTARSSTTRRLRRSSAWSATACCRTAPSAASTACRRSCARRSSRTRRARNFNGLRHDSDWVNSDITVSTTADQIAIAPGYRESDITENGRRTIRYRSDAPINNFFSVQSARYEVAKDRWNDVELAVYYDRAHGYNVPRMHTAMKASLDYFTAHFSPFQFRQVRILEFPAYARFAQSFANTIPYAEGIGFIADYRDDEKIDMVTYVTAHEVGAPVVGSPGHQRRPAGRRRSWSSRSRSIRR